MENLFVMLFVILSMVAVSFLYFVPVPTKETWHKNKFLYIVMEIITWTTFFFFLYSIFDGIKSFFTIFIFSWFN